LSVKVVTDSASDLPLDLAEQLDVTVVPVKVIFGTEEFLDGVELPADDFYDRLVNGSHHPTTAAPSIGEMVEVYDRVGEGADGVVSIHVSSKLSATYDIAVQAKGQANVGCPIEVVDTQQASLGLAMVVLAAGRVASDGGDVESVAERARSAISRAQCMAVFDTLEYLQRGGRIGKARALLGTILRIKPMVIVRDGEVQPLGRARTISKGIARMQELARGFAPIEELAVPYSTTPELAETVAEGLRGLLPEGKEPFIARFGPGVGTHVGPGAVGLGILQAEGGPPSSS
jgi:DegV family protein with EDD domain